MTSSACEEVRRHLEWFVGDDLDASSAVAVRAHLRDCVQCRNNAGSLQQALKGLRELATSGHPSVDDSMFADLHASIVARVEAEALPVDRRLRVRRMMPIAAAAAVLFAVGWWSVREPRSPSVFDRAPMTKLVNSIGPVKAVPWSGPRVPLQKLGNESVESDDGFGGVGPGMMGRWRLRTLEGVDVPPRSTAAGLPGDR